MASLVCPEHVSRASFAAAVAEYRIEDAYPPSRVPDAALETDEGYAAWCAAVRAERDEEPATSRGFVPMTTLFWAEGDEFIGQLSIRHRLTEWLWREGGHIGYDVRPSRRRLGHATAMLAASLPIAKALGIDPALVTCDDTNEPSCLVIERTGGQPLEPSGHKLRFFVPTGPSPG